MPYSTCAYDGCEETLFSTRRPKKWCDNHHPTKQTPALLAATVCMQCGKDISDRRHGSKYCGVNCNQAASYYRNRVLKPKHQAIVPMCIDEECERQAHARGMCRMHYRRWERDSGKANPPSDAWTKQRKANWRKARAKRKGAPRTETLYYDSILRRDSYVCALCSQPIDPSLEAPDPMSASIDHRIPLSKGGNHTRDNVQAAHLLCNMRKGNRLTVSDLIAD